MYNFVSVYVYHVTNGNNIIFKQIKIFRRNNNRVDFLLAINCWQHLARARWRDTSPAVRYCGLCGRVHDSSYSRPHQETLLHLFLKKQLIFMFTKNNTSTSKTKKSQSQTIRIYDCIFPMHFIGPLIISNCARGWPHLSLWPPRSD